MIVLRMTKVVIQKFSYLTKPPTPCLHVDFEYIIKILILLRNKTKDDYKTGLFTCRINIIGKSKFK